MEAERLQHPITVEEYDRMAEAGVFGDARLELINGRLIDVPPHDPPHAGAVWFCHDRIRAALGANAIVRAQLPLCVGQTSQPEPDVAIVRADARGYRDRHPSIADTVAVVEVAHSSLAFDAGEKLLLYAKQRIPEYWILVLQEQLLRVYREPHDLGYGRHEEYRRGQTASFIAFPDVAFSVDELLG
jgi:Uma2 family endonuclease